MTKELELFVAVLAAEITETIENELGIKLDALTFYPDSKVVLGYICNQSKKFFIYVNKRYRGLHALSNEKSTNQSEPCQP